MADGIVDSLQPEQPARGPQPRPALNRRTFAQAAIGAVAAAGAAGLTYWSAVRHAEHGEREPGELTRHITAPRVTGTVPRDPAAAAWKAIAPLQVPLMQQYMVAPRLQPEGLIPSVELRTMHNGSEIGFHVTWEDRAQDDVEVVGRFRDSVAVQLPVDPSGPVVVVMGQPGRPVHVLHWRASWQRNVRSGPRSVRDAFPFAFSDLSPEDLMSAEQARAYYPSWVAGNPLADRERSSPIEELVAEGYGTITSHAQQRAQGGGVHANGRWEVAMVIPMAGGHNQATLRPGQMTHVALAVWNGAKGDRGARKQFADWTALELEA
jgi:hypothetical protein